MKLSNFFWFTGLWLYLLIAGMAYMFLTGVSDLIRAPDWAYPAFVIFIPMIIPAVVTVTNIQRQKRGHTDFGFLDAIGKRRVEPHETPEYHKAAYPVPDHKFLMKSPTDLVLGLWRGHYIGCRITRDGMNAFLIGNIGSGKSSFLKAIILACLYRDRIAEITGKPPGLPFNFFVIDIKPEIFPAVMKIYGHYRAEDPDNLIQVVQPSNRESWGWDVLYLVHRPGVTETDKIKAAADIAEALIEESGDNPYFSTNARKILSGVLLHYIEKNWDFIPIMKKLMRSNLDQLLKEICDEAEEAGEGVVLDKLKGFVGKKDNESLQDVEATMKERLDCLSYPDIVYMLHTNPNRTSPAALDDGVTNLDLAIEQDKLEVYNPLFRLLTMQVLKHCESYKESDERNTLLIIDEAARCGQIAGLDGAMATLRSRHVGILLCFQNLHQFLDIYKEHRAKTLLSLSEVKVALSGDGDSETTDYFSGMAGQYMTEKHSYAKGSLGERDVKYSDDMRDIIDTQTMMDLKEKNEAIAILQGHYYRFKKVKYYEDRILGPIYREIAIYNKQHEETQETAIEEVEEE
ncbi:MAG: type IV secretory system conjugative DNA transfer family protein [Lachnospiraceae bacterium]|nr:type IV secretory system conjugative DNA transfer family protein [Lachnospiraceae bacterium]